MVDSTPTSTGPPSTIRSIRPARSLCTWAAVVGETWPDRLAEGATTGPPKARRIVARHRVGGHADRDGLEAGGGEIGHRAAFALGQHQRQRPRPERLRQRRWPCASKRAIRSRRCEIPDMGDQRIERGPALGLRKGGRSRRHWWRRRRARRRSRSGTRPGRPRRGIARPRPRRPRRQAVFWCSGRTFTGVTDPRIRQLAVGETQGYKPRS